MSTLAVWKFASCDGCQLSILDCEDELLALAAELDVAYFLEAGRSFVSGDTTHALLAYGSNPATAAAVRWLPRPTQVARVARNAGSLAAAKPAAVLPDA